MQKLSKMYELERNIVRSGWK